MARRNLLARGEHLVYREPYFAQLAAESLYGNDPGVIAKLSCATLRQFIDGCIAYTQETGEVLDLVGDSNVVFLNNGRCKLVDVLTTKMTPITHVLPGILEKVQNQEGLNARGMNYLMNGLGYIRFVNFKAAWLNLPERLEVPDKIELDGQTWAQVQKVLHTSPRISTLRRPTENAVGTY